MHLSLPAIQRRIRFFQKKKAAHGAIHTFVIILERLKKVGCGLVPFPLQQVSLAATFADDSSDSWVRDSRFYLERLLIESLGVIL